MRSMATDAGYFLSGFCFGKTNRMLADRMIQLFVFMAIDTEIIDVFLDKMRSFAACVRRMTCYAICGDRVLYSCTIDRALFLRMAIETRIRHTFGYHHAVFFLRPAMTCNAFVHFYRGMNH